MFKFVHCADLHLDSPLSGLSARPDAPVEEIRGATRRALENLVTLCLQERVSFVLIAGDVYDGDWPDYNTGLFFNACMARLGEANIPVYMISGNHDAASQITRNLVLPQNVTRFAVDQPETYLLDEFHVAIHGQGFKQRDVRDDLVVQYPAPLPGYLNIGILHTSVQGQEGHEPYAPCRLDELIYKGYDYWALGHIHKRQVLNTNPYIVYPGNLQGRHVRETGNKGCTVVTVDNGVIALAEHHDLDVLRWAVCEVDLTNAQTDEEFVDCVSDELTLITDEHPGYPLAVRVILQGQTELHGRLMEDPERYRREIDNAVVRIGARVWIEKVKFKTVAQSDSAASLQHANAMTAIRQTVAALSPDDPLLQTFLADVKKAQQRMTAYVQKPDALRVDAFSDLSPLLQEATDLLIEMMGKGGVRR